MSQPHATFCVLAPDLSGLSHEQKDSLILELWNETVALRVEVEHLRNLNTTLERRLSELETKLNQPPKDSSNSSVPPSKDRKKNKPVTRGSKGTRKASVGRKGGGRPLHPDPDQQIHARAKTCPHCGIEVPQAEQHLHAVYDKIEIPPVKPVVTRVHQYGGHCASCHQDFVSPVPKGMEPGSPFGASIQTLATYYRYTHAIGYERLSRMFADLYNLPISEGALANLFQAAKTRIDDRTAEILERIRSSRLICSDETSVRVNGRNEWEWVFQNQDVCVHVIRPSRGSAVIQEVLAGHRPKIWVSDLLSSQKTNPAELWQVCLAHQLRDCQYAVDAGDSIFAPRMKRVLLRAIAIHRRRGTLAQSTLYNYRLNMKQRLHQCLALEPAQADGIRLKKRYLDLKDNLFLFLEDATIPTTNNSSEQAFRMSKLFMKVTNCFRSNWGKELFAGVRSVINTGKRQGLNAYQAIKRALSPFNSFFGSEPAQE
jgi:transposase